MLECWSDFGIPKLIKNINNVDSGKRTQLLYWIICVCIYYLHVCKNVKSKDASVFSCIHTLFPKRNKNSFIIIITVAIQSFINEIHKIISLAEMLLLNHHKVSKTRHTKPTNKSTQITGPLCQGSRRVQKPHRK